MTAAQSRIFAALAKWQKEHDYAPSLEELARAVRVKSISTVHVHIKNLIAQGKVRRQRGKFSRGFEVVPEHRCPTCGQPVSAPL